VEWSWRAIFLINVPLAVVIVVIALRHVPESRDVESAPGLDVVGTVLAVLGLGGLTYGLTGIGERGATPDLLVGLLVGVLAVGAFVQVERRSPHPLVPPALFANATFTAANAVTLLMYGALGVVFLLLVLQLQVVAGFTPLAAGAALLPVTVIMLVFSARAGALAGRIGPRLPMTLGPLISAAGLLLLLRVDTTTSWLVDVLPAVSVFGAGLTLTVAPLTSTVLDAAPDRFAGAASGVNNAVARAAGLLAVAVVPGLAGISGEVYTDPIAFSAGFRTAMMISTGLLVAAAAVAFTLLRHPRRECAPERLRIEGYAHCGVTGPQIYPRVRAAAR
jgi:predicted MFS family arabinose efflux permease